MDFHFNLYYLFLEDQQKWLLTEAEKMKNRKMLEDYYRALKPPWAGGEEKKTRKKKFSDKK